MEESLLELSASELDKILEIFDQTEPGLQRKIVGRFVQKAEAGNLLVRTVLDQIDDDPLAAQFFDQRLIERMRRYLDV